MLKGSDGMPTLPSSGHFQFDWFVCWVLMLCEHQRQGNACVAKVKLCDMISDKLAYSTDVDNSFVISVAITAWLPVSRCFLPYQGKKQLLDRLSKDLSSESSPLRKLKPTFVCAFRVFSLVHGHLKDI